MTSKKEDRLHRLAKEWFTPGSKMWKTIHDVIEENNTLRRINEENLEKLDHAQRLAQMIRDANPHKPEGTEVYVDAVAKKLARKRNGS